MSGEWEEVCEGRCAQSGRRVKVGLRRLHLQLQVCSLVGGMLSALHTGAGFGLWAAVDCNWLRARQ